MNKEKIKLFSISISFIKKYKIHLSLIALGVLLILISYVYWKRYLYFIRDPKNLKTFIMSYGRYSIVVLVLIQILQVIVFFIPGGFVQIAAGYIYGTFLGTVIVVTGTIIGSIVTFALARRMGRPFITKIVSEKDISFFKRLLHTGHDESKEHKRKNMSLIVIFFLYLIPGIPKDALGYICGITDIALYDFIIYSTVARLPAVIVSSYFGAGMYHGNKIMVIVISVIMSILFIVGVIKGEKIIKTITKK
jgi:uncharacterized membrane protein YdjX (TVP38/TMEM64 family)